MGKKKKQKTQVLFWNNPTVYVVWSVPGVPIVARVFAWGVARLLPAQLLKYNTFHHTVLKFCKKKSSKDLKTSLKAGE